MKKFLALLCCVAIGFSLSACSQATESVDATVGTIIEETTTVGTTEITTPIIENPNFRNVKWGMTKNDVISAENEVSEIDFGDDVLYENIDVAGYLANLTYSFDDNYLYRGLYQIKTEHTNYNDYIDDFSDLKEKCILKYGEPEKVGEKWSSDLFKDKPTEYGFAVAMGYLSYYAGWDVDGTRIFMALIGDNMNVSLLLGYSEIGYEPSNNTDGL